MHATRAASVHGRLAHLTATVDAARGIGRRIATSDYVLVGDSRRYRALQRRRTRTASRAGLLVIAAAAIFDAIAVFDPRVTSALVLLVLNGSVAALALAGWATLGRSLRRHPEAVAGTVTLLLTLATAATGALVPELALETLAYLLLLPGLIALILPWRTRTHVRWLVGYAAITVVYLALAPSTGMTSAERTDLIVVDLIAVAASVCGHVLLQLGQIRSFVQVRKIQALRRRADADRAELARAHRALEQTARTDALTGASNRTRLFEDLRSTRARMDRLRLSVGLVAIDLDRFKLINDRLGHVAGDDALRRVVATIQATIRAEDAVYRIGGEEFIVLARVADMEGLQIVAERLRRAVAELAIAHPENLPMGVVTVSVGAALITPDELPESDDDWFRRADVALYEAKERGRNQVVLAA